MGIRGWRGQWMVLLFSVSSLSAASADLRLVEAVKREDKETVRSLLKQQVDVNAPQGDGTTALFWAAHRDDLEMAELLISTGANVNAANQYGATPLWLACTNGNAAMVEKLLKAGADPNVPLLSGETALMAAAGRGSMQAVKSLLTAGADVNAKETRGGQTALMWAVAEKHPEVARWLLEYGADVRARSRGGFTSLLFAAQQSDMDLVQILLAAGADVNETSPDGMSPLLMASANGHEVLLTFLLDKGADPNAANNEGYTALHYVAADRNTLNMAKALLAHGANPNARLVSDPAKGDSSTNYIGATPFFMAAVARNVDIMHALVASGADGLLATTETNFLNGSNGRRLQMVAGTTPLMAAAGAGRYRGNYPEFTEAEEKSAIEAVKLALELGPDINAANAYGQTALHIAAYLKADTLIQFLVEKGAKMDVMDKFGQTPLSIAQRIHTVDLGNNFDMQPRRLNESTVNLLLKLGATPLAASGVKALEGLSQ
ncbi:MAG: ankyrin repeat domain-containing protein [Acidobacteria bacterium]|nr:ankyrin repeat domain-containing protein [Acidobacteriota bacterium]